MNAGIHAFEHLDGRAGEEGRMPLSDHEQRMLDQIESALYAEDPKFASSVRGGTLRAPVSYTHLTLPTNREV